VSAALKNAAAWQECRGLASDTLSSSVARPQTSSSARNDCHLGKIGRYPHQPARKMKHVGSALNSTHLGDFVF
jgi:hypothetical protein